MEYAAGGDLLRHLQHRSGGHMSEKEARWMFQQIIIGLAYCHERVRVDCACMALCRSMAASLLGLRQGGGLAGHFEALALKLWL